MSGVIQADLYVFPSGAADVSPAMCPIKGTHRPEMPICYSVMHDGVRRACPFWQATVRAVNVAERVDAGFEAKYLRDHARTAGRIGVICTVQRRNVRPGT